MNILMRAAFCSVALVQIMACGEAEEPAVHAHADPNSSAARDENQPVPAARGFSWIVPGELAVMPLPGRDRPLDQDAAFLEQEGIRVLVSLTETPTDAEVLTSRSIAQEHISVQDYQAPTLEQMIEFVAVVEDSVAVGKPVGVHCTAGLGRSGTMAAVYLVSEGASANDAIATVRRLRPGSIETSAQEDAVRAFEKYLDRAW